MEQAINFEIQRQALELMDGRTPKQETRGWDTTHNTTYPQRSKEDAEDYRYFPDPDLPPIRFSQAQIDKLKTDLPAIPEKRAQVWHDQYGVETRFGLALIEDRQTADFYEELLAEAHNRKLDANKVASMIVNGKLKATSDKSAMLTTFAAATQTAEIDTTELDKIISQVLAENPDAVANYKAGKVSTMGFFIGQTMCKLGKKADPSQVKSAIEAQLA